MRPPRTRRLSLRDEQAVACARIYAAFDSLLRAGIAQLLLHYAARLSGLALCARGDLAAGAAALRQERDAAVEALRRAVLLARAKALQAARINLRRARDPGSPPRLGGTVPIARVLPVPTRPVHLPIGLRKRIRGPDP